MILTKAYLGATEAKKIYLGSNLIVNRTAIYQGANPADPNNETDDVTMVNVLTGAATVTSSSVRSTVGTRSIDYNNVGTAVISDVGIPLTGVISGNSYTITIDLYNENVTGNNYIWLDPVRGWTGADVENVNYVLIPRTPNGEGWSTISVTAIAGANNAELIINAGSIRIQVDNIRVVQN